MNDSSSTYLLPSIHIYLFRAVAEELVIKSAKIRANGCFPVLTWANNRNRAAIFRAGQPLPQPPNSYRQVITIATSSYITTIIITIIE